VSRVTKVKETAIITAKRGVALLIGNSGNNLNIALPFLLYHHHFYVFSPPFFRPYLQSTSLTDDRDDRDMAFVSISSNIALRHGCIYRAWADFPLHFPYYKFSSGLKADQNMESDGFLICLAE
jgi:hypothetical protein